MCSVYRLQIRSKKKFSVLSGTRPYERKWILGTGKRMFGHQPTFNHATDIETSQQAADENARHVVAWGSPLCGATAVFLGSFGTAFIASASVELGVLTREPDEMVARAETEGLVPRRQSELRSGPPPRRDGKGRIDGRGKSNVKAINVAVPCRAKPETDRILCRDEQGLRESRVLVTRRVLSFDRRRVPRTFAFRTEFNIMTKNLHQVGGRLVRPDTHHLARLPGTRVAGP